MEIDKDGSVFDMECCPHCSGEKGFRYRLHISGTQLMDWSPAFKPDYNGHSNGIQTSFIQDAGGRHGAYWCEDCGKQVRETGE